MKKLFTLLMLFVAIVTGASAAPDQTFDLTGYSSSIANGKCVEIGGAYVGRKGSTLTPDATHGITTGGGNTAAVFVVNATSTITIIMNNQQTSAKSGTVKLASVTDAYYTDCTNGTLGNMPSSAAQECSVSWVKDEAKGEKEYTFSSSVTAGKYIVYWTSSINGSIYLKRIEINNESTKTIATQEYAGVKKGGATLTPGEDFILSEQVITLADKYAASAAPTDIQLINHRTYTDTSDDYADVDVEFSSTPSDGYFVGTTTIGLTEYTVKVPEVESYTVSYNAGAYGSGSIASGKKYKNVDFTLSSETFTRDGYVQSGWATTDGGEKAYDLGGTYSENAAIELFPAWTEANTYFAPFSVAEGTPDGWTFSIPDPDTWADNNARVAFVKDFADNSVPAPKTNNLGDSYIAFAKNAGAYAIYDLGSAVTVFGIKAQLYGGSSDAFNIKIDYLGADATTVKKSYTVSLGPGNWKLNTITKSDVVNDVRYIKIYGGSKWVVMSGFSVTSTADAVSTGAKITTNAGKWASFTPTYNAIVPAGTEAYIITGIGAGAKLSGTAVSVMEAGKGYFIKGEASTEYTATYTTEAADATDGNMLVGCAKNAALAANDGSNPYQYFLGTDQSTSKAGLFYVGATAITIPAGKCYLQTNSNTPQSLTLPFEDEETAINFVEANENVNSAAPTKVIKDGKLYIGNFNVAGQLVK